jgi:transcriptional regulator with GAF, ATPase, and Fis domain
VLLECDRPFAGSSRHSLRDIDEVTFGRGDERRAVRDGRNLSIALPSPWMSSQQARLHNVQGAWHLEDSGSRNGTTVNGVPAVHSVLRDGDLVEMGRTLLLFRDALHAPPDTPLDVDTREGSPPLRGLATLVPALGAEFDALARIAASPVPVLVRGETGTGKELIARAVHTLSQRMGAFVPVNCGAIPQALVEGQLFGHVKGAFSGAVRDEPGFVRTASGGTLFLDEVGDLPAASQAALLRVLQEGEVLPVGSSRPVRVDLRVVAATNQPLEALVARGAFRADLLARLDGFTCMLPPVRERREDIGLLVGDLLQAAAQRPDSVPLLAPEVARAFFFHGWPFNVRELRQCLARATALARDERVIVLGHLPPAVSVALSGSGAIASREADSPEAGADASGEARLRRQLELLLEQHNGNVAEVARAMGKARMQVHRWMKRFGIEAGRFRS